MLIGIDGGGTKTTFVLSDDELNEIKRINLGPTSIRTVPFDKSMATLIEGIESLLEASDKPVESLFAGVGDVSDEEDAEMVRTYLKSIPELKDTSIRIGNDIECAHAGAHDNGHGITVIIGTGSVVYASDEKNGSVRVGGYSYKEGDPGSAYAIGRRALDLIGRVHDKRLEDSLLVEALRNHLNVYTFKDIVLMHEKMHANRTETAKLARLVTEYAKKKDHHALRILDEASDEILHMIETAMNEVQLIKKRIAFIGGLGTAKSPYRDMIDDKLRTLDEELDIIENIHEPVKGSLYLTKNVSRHN